MFATDANVSARDKRVAGAAAWVEDARIVMEHVDGTVDGGPLRDDAPAAAQVAAALCVFGIEALRPGLRRVRTSESPFEQLSSHGHG